jgi:hypothetical protein
MNSTAESNDILKGLCADPPMNHPRVHTNKTYYKRSYSHES